MSEAKLKIQAALGDASVDMLSDMGSIPITFTIFWAQRVTSLSFLFASDWEIFNGCGDFIGAIERAYKARISLYKCV